MSLEMVEETLMALQESQRDPLLDLVAAVSKWVFSVENDFPLSLGNITSFALSLFRVDFRCVHRFQLLKVCNQYVTPFQIPPAYRAYPRNNLGKTFFPN